MRAILQAVRTGLGGARGRLQYFGGADPMHNCVPRVFWAVALTAGLALDASAAKQTVKIAYIGPLTGGVSANGIGGRNSADLAVRLRNADPKARYRYELVSLDDECKPNIAVQAATKAASDNSIIAGVTHYCSVAASAAVDTDHKCGFPAVVWGAVLPDITYRNNYGEVHRVNGTMINQNDVAAKFMTGLKYKRWVIIHDTTDYGKGHDKYFTEYVTKYGGQVLGRFGVTADQQDFTAELTKAKELKPEVIYFGGLTPIGVRIRSQMERPGGLYFIGKYAQQKYDQGPEAYGPFAFTAAGLIMDVIEQVGPQRRKVIEELRKTRDKDSIVGKISFDDHGQNVVPLITKYVVQDGKWVVWEDSEYASGRRKLK